MTGHGATESGYRERNSTADRAIEILVRFSDHRPTWTAAEIAVELGVARSTSYRYLQSLVAAGMLEEADRGFQLGPRILELARVARRGMRLTDVARPVMNELSAVSRESVLLTRRSGAHVVCVDAVPSPHPIRLSYEPGHVLPLNAGAAAHVLLAGEDAEAISQFLAAAPLTRFTQFTITDHDAFTANLAEITKRGYAISRGELDPEVIGIAAPIHGADGAVRAAVSIAALSSRVTESDEPTLIEMVRRAADQISERLALYEA